jgi:hypothetical protein
VQVDVAELGDDEIEDVRRLGRRHPDRRLQHAPMRRPSRACTDRASPPAERAAPWCRSFGGPSPPYAKDK